MYLPRLLTRSLFKVNFLNSRTLCSISNSHLTVNKHHLVRRHQQLRFNSITASTDGSIIPDDVQKLTSNEYHKVSNDAFEQMVDELDMFFEDNKILEAEITEEAGSLEINCSEGTYVINKQAPTKQIWLSSPISGPKRFDYHNGRWICLRDGEKLSNLLQNEITQMYGDFQWSNDF